MKERTAKGTALVNLLRRPGETIAAIIQTATSRGPVLVFATANGR